MTEFNIKKINSKLLFLVRYLVNECKKARERNSSTHRGEKFFSFIGFDDKDHLWEKIPDEEWSKYFIDLCIEFGVIREIYFDVVDDKWDFKNPLKSEHYKYGIADPLDVLMGLGVSSEKDRTIFCSIDLDTKKAEKFVNEYLSNWLNNNLIKEKINLLKTEKQIEEIVKRIYWLLQDHPDKNLLVDYLYINDRENIDFIATIFFLEKLKYCEILNIDATQYKYWVVRINICKKFYGDFKRSGWLLNDVKFDFNYLKTGKKAETHDDKTVVEFRNHKQIKNQDNQKLLYTEDGKLIYPGFEPIFDLTTLQRKLCKILFEKEANYIYQTIDLEEKVYVGQEATKQRQQNFKKLVERLNESVKAHFRISEMIRYGSDTTRRLA